MKTAYPIPGPLKRIAMEYICLFVLVWAAFGNGAIAAPVSSVTVRSVYLDGGTGTWGKQVLWQFAWEGQGKKLLVRQDGRDLPIVRIVYGEDGTVQEIWKQIRGHEIMETSDTGILLSMGYPVPYDHLGPVENGSREIVIKRRAGAMRFSFKVWREVAGISLAEALSRGMVNETDVERLGGRDLRLITIRKAGKRMVLQLWAAGDPLWLYEETPARRSWRVD